MKRPHVNNANDKKRRKHLNTQCESNTPRTYVEGELGIIEQVTVQNFMCHENLTLNFEPHMNFIIGQNGSGKSAVLTAIILALGGKSSSTDRFTSIKGFIKTGKNKAKVEIVLRNKGSLAYRPDLYGEKIVVIREFNKDGVSKYKIKSESGTICTESKSELTKIMNAMDIMIECPVCVLTQATSKRFLLSKDAKPERLFEFFYKGTGLEMLENTYQNLNIQREQGEAVLEQKKQVIPNLKKELRKWSKFIDSSNRIYEFKNEKMWAGVIRMEKVVQEKEEEHKKIKDEFEEHKKNLEQCKKSFAEKRLELDELNKQKSNLLVEMEKCRKRLAELNVGYENHSSSYRRNKGTLRRLESDKEKIENDIRSLEKCINEQKQRDGKNLEEEDRKCQEAIRNLKEKNFGIEDQCKTYKEKINTARNKQSNFEGAIKSLSDEINQQHYELQNLDDNLAATKNAIKNKVNAFGEHTEKVLNEMESMRNRFRKLPVGPIGVYLEVKDAKWAAAVEFATGSNLLNSFCVDNHQDSQLLREILKKYYQKPPSIIVSQFESQIFDVQNGKLQTNFHTVLDMLLIKNHQVANCLIDQAQIERKILVEDEREGVALMNNPPKNCMSASAYFINCDQICFNPSRMYSFGKRKPRQRLCAIRAEDISNLEKDKEEKKNRIKEMRGEKINMENAKESLSAEIESLEHDIVNMLILHRRNLEEIQELESKEETQNVDCLQEDLQSLCHSCEQKKEEINQFARVVSELELKRLELQRQKEDDSNTLKSLEKNYNNLDTKIGDVSKRTESFASGRRTYELELRCKENNCKNHRKELEDLQSKLEIARSNAESMCPRISTDRSYEDICRLIVETERVVQAHSDCDIESLRRKYSEKSENLKRAEEEYKRIERWLNRIGDMLKLREANFTKIRQNTELLIQFTFTTILSGNGYTGHLTFDQAKRNLIMTVSPRAGDNARKNHSSLSGGERSFVTIAFLLALWERTKMPFRILDEYDVFMDSSNRQLCVDLLSNKAKEMAKTQFIFLSPLELVQMTDLDCIHILKMAAPKRKGDDDENSPRKKCS